jgi:hypothetical protein
MAVDIYDPFLFVLEPNARYFTQREPTNLAGSTRQTMSENKIIMAKNALSCKAYSDFQLSEYRNDRARHRGLAGSEHRGPLHSEEWTYPIENHYRACLKSSGRCHCEEL